MLSCRAQTAEEQIETTSRNILSAIVENNEKKFQGFIGVDLSQIGKNEELLHLDFKKITSYYQQYVKERNPVIINTGDYNEAGNLKVAIPFNQQTDSTNLADSVQLELYFGPPEFVPLNKIANNKPVIISPQRK
jgi:hypothetical protein